MATQSKIPWDKLKADTLRAICRDFGANPGKRKREGMLEFLRAVETTGLDEALKLNIEDKDESSPRRPAAKRARPAEEQAAAASAAAPAESAAEGAGRPKRKAAPAPATEAPVKSRGKKAKTEGAAPAPAPATAAAAPAAAAPASKAKKGGEKKASAAADDDAAKDQQEADEVDALADELAENGPANPDQEAPNETGPNATPGGVVIESSKVKATVISQAA